RLRRLLHVRFVQEIASADAVLSVAMSADIGKEIRPIKIGDNDDTDDQGDDPETKCSFFTSWINYKRHFVVELSRRHQLHESRTYDCNKLALSLPRVLFVFRIPIGSS